MQSLARLKLREKIGLSFGGLIVLIAVNTVIGVFTAYSIARQIEEQEKISSITEEIMRVRDTAEQFIRQNSREASQQTFVKLDQARQLIDGAGPDNERLTSLLPLLDDYRLNFQKYVVQTDQHAALESRATLLGRRILIDLRDARTHRAAAFDRVAFDTMVDQILNLQWQSLELRAREAHPSPENLSSIRESLVKLREPLQRQTHDSEAQRQLYRILQDAADYITSFEHYMRYQTIKDGTEKTLTAISNTVETSAWEATGEARQSIQTRIPLFISLMVAAFIANIIAAIYISRVLAGEILKPVRSLLSTTQAITHGQLDERAEIVANDEIGELAESFNQMTDRLRGMHESLEQLVSERTRQLVDTNRTLQNEIFERNNAEAAIVQSERHLRTIIDLVPHFIFAKNTEGQYILANQAIAEAYGATPEALIGKADRDFVRDEEQLAQFLADDQEVIRSGKQKLVPEVEITDAEGQTRYLQTTRIPYDSDHRGVLSSVLGVAVDITDLKRHQKQLEHIAHFDALTDMPNRVLLSDRLNQAIAQSDRHGSLLAVAYLDLDGFKAVNDKHGHATGDKFLSLLAGRMKLALRESDTLARLGGDEFVAVLLDLQAPESSAPILERLLASAAEPVTIDGLELRVSASLGVTYYPQAEAVDADRLMRQADQAMYLAKQAGKNRYHIFDADHDRTVRGRHEGLERIRLALNKREFVLHYQPKVNMRTGEVIGAEALIRWQHPERGLLPPAAFLSTIENHHLSVGVGEWVLETALSQIEAWRRSGLMLPVSINIDAQQFSQPDFLDKLRQSLAKHPDIQAGDLELEVLETSALADIGQLSELMLACREIGVGFALDDFGTGYSSLTYLKRLPANLLKVDQSFIRDILDDSEDLAILQGVLGLSIAFRRQVIAEGVETMAHGELLLQMGCELGQGYAIARPMPATEIPDWFEGWKPPLLWANQPPVSAEKQPVLFAIVEHRAWVAALGTYLVDMNLGAPPFDSHQCHFSQWLDKEGTARYKSHHAFERIVTLHESIHQRGESLIKLKLLEPHRTEFEGMREVQALRDELLKQLKKLID